MTQSLRFSQASPKLSLLGASFLGVASMLGAGVFVVFTPAATLAGSYLLVSIALAGIVAALNARSMRQLSKVLPKAGGAYSFAREYLSPTWGFVAGLAFVFGKIGSVAAIALAAASYIYPVAKVEVALAALLLMTSINLLGINRTAFGAIMLSIPTVLLLILVGVSGLQLSPVAGQPSGFILGIVPAAALLFFAFAGYARVATLGPEVKNPAVNIPRAIAFSLLVVVSVYFLVGFALQSQLGYSLQFSLAPIQDYAAIALPWLPGEVVVVIAAAACLGSLLSLLAGISRTAEAMAKDGELPKQLAKRSKKAQSPWVAELLILTVATPILLSGDLTWVIGVSSFCVLLYYAIANLAAFSQLASGQLTQKTLALFGGLSCIGLGLFVPIDSLALAVPVLALGLVLRTGLIKLRRPS